MPNVLDVAALADITLAVQPVPAREAPGLGPLDGSAGNCILDAPGDLAQLPRAETRDAYNVTPCGCVGACRVKVRRGPLMF